MKRSPRAARRGESLILLLGVIAAASVLMAVAVSIITLAMQSERASRKGMVEVNALWRLARQFRGDVHRATGLEAAPAEARWTLRMPEGEVQYSAGKRAVERTTWREGRVVQAESYAVARGARVRIERPGDGPLVQLVIEPPAGVARSAGAPVQLEARLGRYAGQPEEVTP